MGALRGYNVKHIRKDVSYVSVATAIGLITAAIAGGVRFGALAEEVENFDRERNKVAEVQKEVQENSETLAAVVARQGLMLQAQERQDKKLDRILDKLEERN